MIRRILRFLAALCLVLGVKEPAFAQPPVWTAQSQYARVTLFGAVHVLRAGLDWKPAALVQALTQADEIWFELPIDQATSTSAGATFLARGTLPKGDTLTNHLTEGQLERLRAACAHLKIPVEALGTMRPWLADATLSLLQATQAGADASQGVEQQLAATTPVTAQRHAFETVAEQVGFLADAPTADQVASLDETAKEIVVDPDAFARLVSAWMSGDVGALETVALAPIAAASPSAYRRLITDRNRRWADRLARRLKSSGNIVVVVGVGHLIGPSGVPALLRARGVSVAGP